MLLELVEQQGPVIPSALVELRLASECDVKSWLRAGFRRAKPLWSCARRRRGTVVIEFALIAPILLITLAAAVDLGTAISRSLRLQTVARAGASYAALIPSDTNNSAVAAMNALLSDISGANATVSISCNCPPSTSASTGPSISCNSICATGTATYVTVTITAPFTPLFSLSPSLSFGALGATKAQIVLRVS